MELFSMFGSSVEKLDEMLPSIHFIFLVVLFKHNDAQMASQYSLDTHDLWNRQKERIFRMVPTICHKIQPSRISKKNSLFNNVQKKIKLNYT